MSRLLFAVAFCVLASVVSMGQELPVDAVMEMPAAKDGDLASATNSDALTLENSFQHDPDVKSDRITFRVTKGQRGSSLTIPEHWVVRYCSDMDGCKLRMGMFNWDNTGRVASRESLFFYNRVNRVWRASAGDRAGTDYDGKTQHAMHAWACYFTDGQYSGWKELGDSAVNFGLLSWNQYNADCFLTIID